MSYKKYRWSKDYEAAEEELELLLSTSAKSSQRHDLDEQQTVNDPLPKGHLLIWFAEGSLVVNIDNQRISLQPGDTLELIDVQTFQATAGIAGAVYYEALA